MDVILKNSIIELSLSNEDVINGTSNFDIAGSPPGFNSAEEFYVYNIDDCEWVYLRYGDIIAMEYISEAG